MEVPVSIIGCGPIGLTGALLLSRFGIKTLIIDKRSEINTHPRSRFVDTNTMELMRELGIEKEIESTGLGPDWTEYNRWFSALTKDIIAEIPSPTFHTVPRDTSPTMPVMTCQDYVENVLLNKVKQDPNIDIRFNTEATELRQDENSTYLTISSPESGTEEVIAQFTLGADGPHSMARTVIGSELETDPATTYSQDVIFEADLSKYVEGRKGGLLYIAGISGVFVFQPLNGETRWRCQIFKPDPELLSNEETVARILEAIGSEDDIPISITSTGMWQPTPGCVSSFREGRILLAGDAAHVFTPTGGMGNNVGFAGIRNLAWKLAFVVNGFSSADILDTYEEEHRPLALNRIATAVETTGFMAQIFAAYYMGGDVEPGIKLTQQYADYDGVLLGYELTSPLIAANHEPPPKVKNETIDFIAAVRAGRRAPHIWIDQDSNQSVLDWFGSSYVLVLGKEVTTDRWQSAHESLSSKLPIELKQISQSNSAPYSDTGIVLVRPDGIIAACWSDADLNEDDIVTEINQYVPSKEPV